MSHAYYELSLFLINYYAWSELSNLNRVYSTASISYNEALKATTPFNPKRPGGCKEEIVEIATLLNNLVRNISTSYEEGLHRACSHYLLFHFQGNVHLRLHAFDEAQNFYSRSFKFKLYICQEDENPDYSNVANSLYNMGTVCLKMGNLTGSQLYFQKAREMHEQTDDYVRTGPHALQIADICSQMGNVHLRLKQYEEALQEYHMALSIRKDVLGVGSADVSATCHRIANVCYAQENYDQALSFYNVALQMEDDKVCVDLFGSIYHSMGNTYAKIGYVEKAGECSRIIY